MTLLPAAECPYPGREGATSHDDQGGALRGPNTVRVFTAGDVSVAHLGDLGHQLTSEQLAAIGHVDAVLVPVGGVYTVDAKGAKAACDALRPRCVIPMHYHHAPYGLPNVAGVGDFLALWPSNAVHRLSGPSFEVTLETAGVLVPAFQAKIHQKNGCPHVGQPFYHAHITTCPSSRCRLRPP